MEVVENIDGGTVALSGREKFDVVLLLSVCHRVMGRWTLKMIGGARRRHCNALAAAAIIGGKIKASQEDPEILMVHM